MKGLHCGYRTLQTEYHGNAQSCESQGTSDMRVNALEIRYWLAQPPTSFDGVPPTLASLVAPTMAKAPRDTILLQYPPMGREGDCVSASRETGRGASRLQKNGFSTQSLSENRRMKYPGEGCFVRTNKEKMRLLLATSTQRRANDHFVLPAEKCNHCPRDAGDRATAVFCDAQVE